MSMMQGYTKFPQWRGYLAQGVDHPNWKQLN